MKNTIVMKTFKLLLLIIVSAVFIIGSCKKDSSSPDDGPTNPVEESPSRVETVTIQSPALGIEKNFNIYLPKGYDESTESYPAVYLFRGHENEWTQHGIQDRVNSLYNADKIGKMILVMPGLTYESNPMVGFPVNMINRGILGSSLSGLGTGQFEDYFIDDLIPYVDNSYRTKANREFRGTDGFSGGAYSAIMIALRHPDLFSTAGCYDGPFGWSDFDDPGIPGHLDDYVWMNGSNFDPYFGNPRDMDYMRSYNPPDMLSDASIDQLNMIKTIHFFIHAACPEATSAFGEGSYFPRTKHLADKFALHGITNYCSEFILNPTADHTWDMAKEHIDVTLPLHWEQFEK
jgi:S-formylglutathione hydrolase FrmB